MNGIQKGERFRFESGTYALDRKATFALRRNGSFYRSISCRDSRISQSSDFCLF
jgi:hypothetical protein